MAMNEFLQQITEITTYLLQIHGARAFACGLTVYNDLDAADRKAVDNAVAVIINDTGDIQAEEAAIATLREILDLSYVEVRTAKDSMPKSCEVMERAAVDRIKKAGPLTLRKLLRVVRPSSTQIIKRWGCKLCSVTRSGHRIRVWFGTHDVHGIDELFFERDAATGLLYIEIDTSAWPFDMTVPEHGMQIDLDTHLATRE